MSASPSPPLPTSPISHALLPHPREPLPIDPLLPEIVARLSETPNLVIAAPPGAGKTTRVPQALLSLISDGEIVVLEPRRIAAQLSALRVAEELGESLGQTVGVQLRFESITSAATRLRFVTEGVLLRQLASDPLLPTVKLVVFDEFHERHYQTDLLLALLVRLQRTSRPDLRLCAMSATLHTTKVAEFLGQCPLIESQGKSFPVDIEYLPLPTDEPLPKQVRRAVREVVQKEKLSPQNDTARRQGDILVFLPGSAEIRRCQEALSELEPQFGLDILPLHGDLSLAEQRQVVAPRPPSAPRRVILSTNLAETSLTIDGVTVVIDSGLHRQAGYDHWSGLPTLKVVPISRASATQRAGRAGRTQPGRCLRLYTKHDHDLRPAFDSPEILRMDLSEPLLLLHALGLRPGDVSFLDPLPQKMVDAAESLLSCIGATTAKADGSRLTDIGWKLTQLPLHPRLARLLLAGAESGIIDDAAVVAALLSERDILQNGRAFLKDPHRDKAASSERSDLTHRLDRFRFAESVRFSRPSLSREGLDADTLVRVDRARRQLVDRAKQFAKPHRLSVAEREQTLERAVLLGFPDRVARRRKKPSGESSELVLASGGSAQQSEQSLVRDAEWLVLVDVEERGGQTAPVARLLSAISPDWLLDVPGDFLVEQDDLTWNGTAGQVERSTKLRFGQLVLDESRVPAAATDGKVLAILSEHATADAENIFSDGEKVAGLLSRLSVLVATYPELGLPTPNETHQQAAIVGLCVGKTSLAELRSDSLQAAVLSALCKDTPSSPTQIGRLLEEHLPDSIKLPGGRRTRIHYVANQPPFIESRLQDFFGMSDGPKLAQGRLPLVIHLLAPNQRAVQVTTDLRGFWARHYPTIRRELMRKYPRHAWPEDPLTAEPPQPKGPRPPR